MWGIPLPLPCVSVVKAPDDASFFGETYMPRAKSLTSMSVDVLLKMRDDVTAAIGKKADALKKN